MARRHCERPLRWLQQNPPGERRGKPHVAKPFSGGILDGPPEARRPASQPGVLQEPGTFQGWTSHTFEIW